MVLRRFLSIVVLAGMLAACGTPAAPATQPTAAPAAGQATAAPAAAAPTTAPAAQPAAPGEKIQLTIGTGGTGGVFFPYGGGLATLLTEKMPNTNATAQETGGSVDNMKLLQSDEAQIGFTTVDSAFDAVNGTGAYAQTGKVPVTTIAVLYQSFVHLIVSKEAGVSTVADLKGKRISVGSAGSSTEAAADRVLEAAGLDPKADITRENLGVQPSVDAMKDQKLDAFFWIGGLPTAAVTDLATTNEIIALDTSALIAPMVAKYGPLYTAMTMPGGTYNGVAQDTPGIGISNILTVREDMPAEQVKAILSTIFDNLADVQKIHPAAQTLTLDTAWTGSSIPFHPAAIEFYKEKGVWKDNY